MLSALSIPVFFVAIACEFLLQRRQGIRCTRFNDAIADLSCGVGSLLTGLFAAGSLFTLFTAVHRWSQAHLPQPWSATAGDQGSTSTSAIAWLLLFLLVDLCYYCFHRASHRINLLWASHIVHHQSEDYNLAVALRQSWSQSLFSWLFYLPLVLLGFSPVQIMIMRGINTLYQFWIHTETIQRLGPLELLFNTPSHHRVHHGVNEEYIDKNYAGALIVWDKLFGTFAAERAAPIYGIRSPLRSFNPVWANVKAWWALLSQTVRPGSSVGQRLALWFAPPTAVPGSVAPDDLRAPLFEIETTRPLQVYVAVQFTGAALLITGLLVLQPPLWPLVGATLWLLATLGSFSGVLQGHAWVGRLESLRLATAPLLCWFLLPVASQAWQPAHALTTMAVAGFAGASLMLLRWAMSAGKLSTSSSPAPSTPGESR